MLRNVWIFSSALALCACTAITGATDYEVDEEREKEERDKELLAMTRDLDYLFDFTPTPTTHRSEPLDIALVDEDDVLQARARIMLSPAARFKEFPSERLVLENGLIPGAYKLYFFVDSDEDYLVDGARRAIDEHIWIRTLDPDGTGEFVHSTEFQFFANDAFTTIGGDFVLAFPALAAQLDDDKVKECIVRELGKQIDDTLEIKVYLESEDRQVGYFKMYKGNPLPAAGEIRLRGLVDNGSVYRFEVLLDGDLKKTKEASVARGDLVLKASDWLPFAVNPIVCLRM